MTYAKAPAYTITNSKRSLTSHMTYPYAMRRAGLWWRCKLYTVEKWITAQLNVMAVTGFASLSPRSPTQCIYQLSYLSTLSLGFVRVSGGMAVCNKCLMVPAGCFVQLRKYLLSSRNKNGPPQTKLLGVFILWDLFLAHIHQCVEYVFQCLCSPYLSFSFPCFY